MKKQKYLIPEFVSEEIILEDNILTSGGNNVADWDPTGEVKDVIDW